jgi:molybdopterin biosynthesis enzyme
MIHMYSPRFDQAVSKQADLILTSAGVSVGAHDYVRAVVEEHGRLDFWRVDVRPGKPLAFGSYRNIPVIGLPGNPVSAYIGFLVCAARTVQNVGFARTHPSHCKSEP